MVDFHGRPASAAAALADIEALAPGRPMFAEEPLPPGEPAALAVLTERFRALENTGLIHRETDPFDGRLVRYCLSDQGGLLRPVLQALYDWGEVTAPALSIRFEPVKSPADDLA
ncbi:winged helix-turn-helix transcriptional regulator [Lichenifustis flavocetrariae]|uniref:Winged helix-turn-helix transcriptional regulator n=1 Tax=Lichenifustis flavocetrariae TaxID=2949735 RepID=A0AA41Z0P3_9HYPH|nr:winged helix-turn-helix transcriptional regulator [Lichenifustis flavocetrariae]MCW6510777.1 winged helix-turn-helix transcriptional regulator [Lichenifustis flavocetrariae]